MFLTSKKARGTEKKMTLYIYYHIDPETVEVETIKGDRRDSYRIGNTNVHMDAGTPVLQIRDGRWKQPPTDLSDKIDRVSIKSTSYDYELDRAPGLYRLNDAEAHVDRISRTGDHGTGIMVEVTASTKESALKLWDAIYRGDVRPYDEMNRKQTPPLIDDDTMQEVRRQAALLARKFLKEEMEKLVAA
ncbi:MAG: hypothetical protein ACI9H6_000291 [Patiriisocius sp.]|jgi:hypothetical protein